MSLLVLGLVLFAIGWRNNRKQRLALAIIGEFIENDATPSFVVSNDGEINSINQAARTKFVTSTGTTLAAVLSQTFANPRGILFRLRSEAELTGAA